jgi:hypothetical protein
VRVHELGAVIGLCSRYRRRTLGLFIYH